LEALLKEADHIESVVAVARTEVRGRAAALHKARDRAATDLADQVRSHLGDLALASARVTVDVQDVEPGASGADRVVIEFASDDRLQAGDIAAVASGGELSRLVLALRLATKSPGTATLVFDEVDTGIGGKTALAMGAKLAELATSSQVLCVTHLPQVAAHADTHYVVERGGEGRAEVRRVEGEERVEEITRMLAGLPDSEAGRVAASELLAAVR
jgi:DNA repair protein RecN (Recombination protein N)